MGLFDTTQWSLILRARGDAGDARGALESLCARYRPSILAYIRGHGYAGDVAEDLTQAFFTRFLEQAWHAHADPARGRFRAFLLTAIKRFLINADEEAHAAKRGGRVRIESFDAATVDLATADAGPERAFERAWALVVLETALRRLREEAREGGKGDLFDHLREFLTEAPDAADYERVAAALGLRRNTLAVAVHRLRHRLRELVRDELAQTSAARADLDLELRDLRDALGNVLQDCDPGDRKTHERVTGPG